MALSSLAAQLDAFTALLVLLVELVEKKALRWRISSDKEGLGLGLAGAVLVLHDTTAALAADLQAAAIVNCPLLDDLGNLAGHLARIVSEGKEALGGRWGGDRSSSSSSSSGSENQTKSPFWHRGNWGGRSSPRKEREEEKEEDRAAVLMVLERKAAVAGTSARYIAVRVRRSNRPLGIV